MAFSRQQSRHAHTEHTLYTEMFRSHITLTLHQVGILPTITVDADVRNRAHQSNVSCVLSQDDVATVATHYVEGLVPHIANLRSHPNDPYDSLGSTLPTDGQSERRGALFTAPHVSRLPTSEDGYPCRTSGGSEGTRVSHSERISHSEIPFGVSPQVSSTTTTDIVNPTVQRSRRQHPQSTTDRLIHNDYSPT